MVGVVSQPAADAERYRCACAGRGNGHHCGLDLQHSSMPKLRRTESKYNTTDSNTKLPQVTPVHLQNGHQYGVCTCVVSMGASCLGVECLSPEGSCLQVECSHVLFHDHACVCLLVCVQDSTAQVVYLVCRATDVVSAAPFTHITTLAAECCEVNQD